MLTTDAQPTSLPLTSSVTRPLATPLPLPWVAAIGYLLDPRALEDVGIFRVPGSTKEVNELFVSLEARNNPDVIALKDCWDPNAVASLIKRMMLESNPRVPLSSAQAAQIARQWQSAPDDVHAVEALVAKLPDLNFSVLFSVFYLFDAVLREEKNRMDSNALGVSIGLSLFAGFSSNATVNGGLLGFLAHNRVQVHRCPAPLQSRQPQSREPHRIRATPHMFYSATYARWCASLDV